MYDDVVSTTKNVYLLNTISRIIFAGALTIFTGALPPHGPHPDDGADSGASKHADASFYDETQHRYTLCVSVRLTACTAVTIASACCVECSRHPGCET